MSLVTWNHTCHLTQVNTPSLNSRQRPVLDLLTLEGWKAELSGYILRWFTRAQTVTYPSTNPSMLGRQSYSATVKK